ncbi:hypothetical protein Tco_0000075 [Tanacetum coccineum]
MATEGRATVERDIKAVVWWQRLLSWMVLLRVLAVVGDEREKVEKEAARVERLERLKQAPEVSDQDYLLKFDMVYIRLSGTPWVVSATHPDRDN